jgi:hypothetical protein
MRRTPYILAGLALAFVALLLYTPLRSTSAADGPGEEQLAAATRECRRAVRASIADARFPFAANVRSGEDGHLELSGSVDAGRGQEAERRNYACFLSPHTPSGGYAADSVQLWKSH